MDLMLLRMFQKQILLQVNSVIRSAREIEESLRTADVGRAFHSIQNLLNATANISKALWGQKGNRGSERKELRDSIGITDSSPLRLTNMRNHFEHFDERIEQWWKESPDHNFVDMNIAQSGQITVPDSPNNINLFRNFDPKTAELTFWGQKFDLRAIVDECQKVLPKLTEEANKPH